MRNNYTIECDTRDRVSACENIVIITHFRPEDAGDYTCCRTTATTFTNPRNEVLSVELGSSIDLHSAISTDLYPQRRYVVWTRDNKYLVECLNLHVKNVTSDMSGLYEIVNGYGDPAAKYYKIIVCKKKSVMNHSQSFFNCTWSNSATRSVTKSTDGI
jgi:hypothetical protein